MARNLHRDILLPCQSYPFDTKSQDCSYQTTIYHPYFDRLYQSTVRWLYSDPYTDTPYTLDSFWDAFPASSEPISVTSPLGDPPTTPAPATTPVPSPVNQHHMTLRPRKTRDRAPSCPTADTPL
jgi:hypothetical protein